MRGQRPYDFDLARLRLPLPAWASLLHRLSGLVLFVALPLLQYLLHLSLSGPAGYARAAGWIDSIPGRTLTALLLWALLHHVLAGLRHLALDVGLGVNLRAARASAAVVVWAAPFLSLAVLALWWR